MTDSNGDAVFEAPAALPAAYVSIIKFEQDLPPEEAGKAIVPAYYYFNPTVNTDMSVSVQMATVTLRNQLTFLFMAPQEDTRGLLLINALNCNLAAAAGHRLQSGHRGRRPPRHSTWSQAYPTRQSTPRISTDSVAS